MGTLSACVSVVTIRNILWTRKPYWRYFVAGQRRDWNTFCMEL